MNQTSQSSKIDDSRSEDSDNYVMRIVDNDAAGQFLTFVLGDEVFGISILSVKEILENTELTHIPMTPKFVAGVINLRGKAIPVIDLNVRLGGSPRKTTKKTCIVIVESIHGSENFIVGILVDAVNEVMVINSEDIEPPPQMGIGFQTDYVRGMGNVSGKFIILLEPNRILSRNELYRVGEEAEKSMTRRKVG